MTEQPLPSGQTKRQAIPWRVAAVVLMVGLVVLMVSLQNQEPPKPEPKPGPPPIAFSFRKSQVPLKGLVAGIRNTSTEETLENFVVRVSSPQEEGERSHRQDILLKPQDSFTVGWMELDGWKLKPGDVLVVTCDQYTGEAAGTVVEP